MFGAAAAAYEGHAEVQRIAARTVADLAGLLRLPDRPHILEIGCGTGILTREMGLRWPEAELVATDLSPRMVTLAGQGLLSAGTFLAMDGEDPCFQGPRFDLIVSSLAFQWFDDLAGAIHRLVSLLRPGGSLVFSTMGQDSLAAWRAAHRGCGVEPGMPDYPSLAALRAMLAGYDDAFAFDEVHPLGLNGARALLAHLKGIGAAVPASGHRPLPPTLLRQVMRAFDAAGGTDAYHVGYARVTRQGRTDPPLRSGSFGRSR